MIERITRWTDPTRRVVLGRFRYEHRARVHHRLKAVGTNDRRCRIDLLGWLNHLVIAHDATSGINQQTAICVAPGALRQAILNPVVVRAVA